MQRGMSSPLASSAPRRVARFATAGVINTLVDYTVFLALSWLLRLPLELAWIAKLGSGAVAMVGSFALNRRWVFRSQAGGSSQLVRFVAVSLVGTFGVQLGGLHLLTAVWPAPGQLAATMVGALGLGALLPAPLVQRTFAFGVATLASMTWNYLAYRRWVFASSSSSSTAASASPSVSSSASLSTSSSASLTTAASMSTSLSTPSSTSMSTATAASLTTSASIPSCSSGTTSAEQAA